MFMSYLWEYLCKVYLGTHNRARVKNQKLVNFQDLKLTTLWITKILLDNNLLLFPWGKKSTLLSTDFVPGPHVVFH